VDSRVLEFGDLPMATGVLGLEPTPGAASWDAQGIWIERSEQDVRLLLRGGVRAAIAGYEFEAERALVWMRGTPQGIEVFACFAEVGGASQGTTSVASEWLAVRAMLARDARTTLWGDLIDDGAKMPWRDDAITALIDRGERERARVVAGVAGRVGTGEHADAPAPNARFTFDSPSQASGGKRWLAALPEQGRQGERGQAQATSVSARSARSPERPSRIPGLRGAGREVGGAPGAGGGVADETTGDSEGAARVGAMPSRAPRGDVEPARAPIGPIIPKMGIMTIGAGDVSVITPGDSALGESSSGEDAPADSPPNASAGNVLIASGGVTILYRENVGGRTLQLSAQRAVLFTQGGTGLDTLELDAGDVRGIYLEGEVHATDGQYTLRAPKVYYDVASNRAIMLDAVFSTFDVGRGLPLYVRAEEVRQESARQFRAKRATLTNSAFFDPELSIGASSVTITRETRETRTERGGDTDPPETSVGNRVVAEDLVLRAGGVPVFYWPVFAGDPEQPLLRDLRFENRSGSGAAVRAQWNALAAFGLAPSQNVSADLLTDYYVERGPAVGGRVSWDTPRHKGSAFGYMLPSDSGTDVLKTGVEQQQDDQFRGLLVAEDRFRVSRDWTILSELATISDETFVDGFFEQSGETRREFATRVRGERTRDNSQLTIEGKGSFNDFLANEWLLQSRGFSVQKLPEVAYVRQSDDLLESSSPGMLTHSSEYRLGRYALAFDEALAQDRGLTTLALSQRALGVDPGQSPADALRARGLTEEPVLRADTRHELVLDASAGPAQITPFVVARGTYYDADFEGFSRSTGGNDSTRLWTAAGVHISTEASTILDTIDSRLLDIHRLRHIIRPSATLWTAGTSIESADIPSFDSRVDNPADGTAVRLGLAQVFQTKRGAPGRLHDVDLLKINTDVVFSSEDASESTPIGRFFDSRPEYSALGDYFVGDAAYRLTDAVSLSASTIYDLETNQQDMTTLGVLVTHQPGFSTLADLRYINPQDSTVLSLWGSYDLTDKYNVQFSPSYDTGKGEVQSVWVRVNRRFTAFEAGLTVTYDNIAGETGFGFVFVPYGARGGVGSDGASSIYGAGGL
jgi:hypothetical protein